MDAIDKFYLYLNSFTFLTHLMPIIIFETNKQGKIMEITNTILFGLYGGVLFTLTALAIYFSDKLAKA